MLAESNTLACLWFGGFASGGLLAGRKAQLQAAVEADEDWELVDPASEPYVMQYNDPFTPPWARRSEVALPVRRRTAQESE